MPNTDPTQRFLIKRSAHFASTIVNRADDLARLADELRRLAQQVPSVGTGGPASYAAVAHDVQKATEIAVMNLLNSALTAEAYDLDEVRLNPAI